MFSGWNIYDFVCDEYAQFLSWDSDSLTDLRAPCLFFYCTSMNERVEHRKLDINYYSETKSYIEDFKYFVFEKKKRKKRLVIIILEQRFHFTCN